MTLLRLPNLLAILLAGFSTIHAEVIQITWPTVHAAQPVQLPAPAADFLPSFRVALSTLPESSIVALALSQPAILGLSPQQALGLQQGIAQRYQLMEQSPDYTHALSALAYCYSAQKPATGLASIYVPKGANAESPVILFLHGLGGSFLWYQHYLSESFPHHLIICPAYGVNPATIPQTYVEESIAAASRRLGFAVSTPCLVGLSAGGFGVCRLYVAAPNFYSQMICLGAYPMDDTVNRFGRDSRPRFLSGAAEPFVTSGDFRQRINRVRSTCPGVEAVVVSGADHFFLLTQPKETVEQLRRWISQTTVAPGPLR